MKDALAVILGGGRGTRLFPLTLHRSKPAVVEAGFVSATHLPTGVSHQIVVASDGSILKSSTPTAKVEDFNSELMHKADAWACVIANQPRDPRPRKKET